MSLVTQNSRVNEFIEMKLEVENLKHLVAETNTSMVNIVNQQQQTLEERINKADGFIGWEYSRTTEWSSRHGTIPFDRMLIDDSDGAYEVSILDPVFEFNLISAHNWRRDH